MTNPLPGRIEDLSCSPWECATPPDRILVIRFHAIGDVALILPALAWLRNRWPNTRLDFLTMAPAGQIALSVPIFGDIIILPNPRSKMERALLAARTAGSLRRRKYDYVIDLQRNWVSRLIRRACGPRAWTEFERYSPVPASTCVLAALKTGGLRDADHHFPVPLTAEVSAAARARLAASGRVEGTRLVVLNPAGLWPTRNWPLENYVALGRLWGQQEPVQFMVLGTERIGPQGALLEQELGRGMINLVGKTSLAEAFAIVRYADVIVTEDSGLMHMAWAAGVPVVALFGSSKHYRSSPQGDHVVCLHSGDLPCGACMDPECRYNDVRCLSRHTPQTVLDVACDLLRRFEMHSREARS